MPTAFTACGVVTLMTDFGLSDPFVGVMKGVIFGRHPGARIVDLTHGIQPYSPREAGFWLNRSFKYFPAGTVHVCVVDPGVGTARGILAVEAYAQLFLAPDNGLLTALLNGTADARVYRLDTGRLERLHLPVASATFHGRDIFAPVAAELAGGSCRPEELGPPVTAWQVDTLAAPEQSAGAVAGVIVTVDRFGNLLSNIETRHLAPLREPVVYAAGRSFPVRRTYGDGAPGDYLALVNAFGVLELAQAQGNAHATLGLERGAAVVVRGQ